MVVAKVARAVGGREIPLRVHSNGIRRKPHRGSQARRRLSGSRPCELRRNYRTDLGHCKHKNSLAGRRAAEAVRAVRRAEVVKEAALLAAVAMGAGMGAATGAATEGVEMKGATTVVARAAVAKAAEVRVAVVRVAVAKAAAVRVAARVAPMVAAAMAAATRGAAGRAAAKEVMTVGAAMAVVERAADWGRGPPRRSSGNHRKRAEPRPGSPTRTSLSCNRIGHTHNTQDKAPRRGIRPNNRVVAAMAVGVRAAAAVKAGREGRAESKAAVAARAAVARAVNMGAASAGGMAGARVVVTAAAKGEVEVARAARAVRGGRVALQEEGRALRPRSSDTPHKPGEGSRGSRSRICNTHARGRTSRRTDQRHSTLPSSPLEALGMAGVAAAGALAGDPAAMRVGVALGSQQQACSSESPCTGSVRGSQEQSHLTCSRPTHIHRSRDNVRPHHMPPSSCASRALAALVAPAARMALLEARAGTPRPRRSTSTARAKPQRQRARPHAAWLELQGRRVRPQP